MEKKVRKAKHKVLNKQETINWELVNSALQAGCSGVEVASKLGMIDETLQRACRAKFGMAFSEYAMAKRSEGDLLLKMKMFQIAMNGDRAMLIFLAKTRLGMIEEHKVEITNIPQISWSTEIPSIMIETEKEKDAITTNSANQETGVGGLLLEP